MTVDFRLTEYAQLHTRVCKHLLKIIEDNSVGLALNYNRTRCRGAKETDFRHWKTQKCTGMQSELAHILRNHRHHTRIVGARRYFAENNLIAFHEELHTEDAIAAKSVGHSSCHSLCLIKSLLAHRLRLPGITVVAIDLDMADRCTEYSA